MKVIFLNTSERTGGAAVAAGRLRQALSRMGVQVDLLVREDTWLNRFRFYWERGVRDLYRLVSEEPEMLAGALVADKVVGKGAAALLAYGKVSGVYALVMSTPARELLEQNGVEVRCKQEVDHIVNRLKTDWCPVEKLCRNLNTPEMCVKEIAKFIASQGQNK